MERAAAGAAIKQQHAALAAIETEQAWAMVFNKEEVRRARLG